MTNLVPRTSFFQDLFDFPRDFDQIFNRMLSGWPFGEAPISGTSTAVTPAMELTISGERKEKRNGKDWDVHYEEISYGAFERTLTLPEGWTGNKLTAQYTNGVLEVKAPVAVTALPRRIEVKAAPMSKQIAA